MTWLWMLIGGVLIGFVAGCIVSAAVDKKKVFGTIRCDDGNSLYLVMEKDPEDLRNVNKAVFNIDMVSRPGSHE